MTEAVTIQDVYDEVKTVERNLSSKFDSVFRTIEIMSNPKLMKSIKQGIKELDAGKGLKPINRVADLL